MRLTGARVPALDGLRGVAALVVVFGHALGASSRAFVDHDGTGLGWSLWVHTPLRLLWAGDAAVIVFFVLSGYVLTPAAGKTIRWSTYYPRRLARLYLPVAAAVVAAVVLVVLVPRVSPDPGNWWLTSQTTLTGQQFAQTVTLTHPAMFMTQLWSLKWEVAFSLALPAYLWVINRMTWLPAAVVLIASTVVGGLVGSPALTYLPVFGMGVVAAVAPTLSARQANVVAGVGLLALSSWQTPIQAAGAGLLVAAVAAGAGRSLGRESVQVLGRLSFSLYLVHIPVMWLAIATGLHGAPLVAAVIGGSLLAAWPFWLCVERPSTRLAKGLGQRTRSQWQATSPAPPATREAPNPI